MDHICFFKKMLKHEFFVKITQNRIYKTGFLHGGV